MKAIVQAGVPERSNDSSSGLYALAEVERLIHLPRRVILAYFRQGLVAPAAYSSQNGFYFNAESVATLRRLERFRGACGRRPEAIQLIINLTNTIAQLRSSITLQPPRPDE